MKVQIDDRRAADALEFLRVERFFEFADRFAEDVLTVFGACASVRNCPRPRSSKPRPPLRKKTRPLFLMMKRSMYCSAVRICSPTRIPAVERLILWR